MLSQLDTPARPTYPLLENGAWQNGCYGLLLSHHNGRVQLFQTSSRSCFVLHSFSGRLRQNRRPTPWGEMTLAPADSDLTIRFGQDAEPLLARPVPFARPDRSNPDQLASPLYNFDVFWQTFADHYPFFDLYGVDWSRQYERYRPEIKPVMPVTALFAVLQEMVWPLQDEQISITWGDQQWSPYQGVPAWRAAIQEVVAPIAGRYIHDLKQTAQRTIRYGWLAPRLGYIMLATCRLSDNVDADILMMRRGLQAALGALAEADEWVLDLRFNEGGHDEVALALASLWADRRRLVLRRRAQLTAGFTEWQEIYVEPAGAAGRPITVLTSSLTVGAADLLALALKQFPHVRHIGERTAGFFSAGLPRFFPNGNQFRLSHQVSQDAGWRDLEAIGCRPDTIIPLRLATARKGTDMALDWAKKHRRRIRA